MTTLGKQPQRETHVGFPWSQGGVEPKDRLDHRLRVMRIWTERLPGLLMWSVCVLVAALLGAALYANYTKDPCTRCLDNAHDTWDCAANEYIADCLAGRRYELDRCLTLCPKENTIP